MVAHWTIYEWLLLQFAILAFIFAVGFGVSFTLSKSRVKRLQNEFHKMAESIGDLLSHQAEDSGTRLETLLVQTEAHIASLDVPSAWRDLDPLEYPHLIPLFMRCSLIEAELDLLQYLGTENYWERLSKAYDDVLFRFTRDLQKSNMDSLMISRKLEESEALVRDQKHQIEELLKQQVQPQFAQPKPAEENQLVDTYNYASFNQDELDDGFEERLIKDLMSNKNNNVDTQGQNLAMLNNVIENQKERIKSLQKDLKRLQYEKSQSHAYEATPAKEAAEAEPQLDIHDQENEALQKLVNQMELELSAKNNELRQLTTQLEMLEEQSQKNQPQSTVSASVDAEEQDEVKRLLIQAWNRSEKAVVMLEKKLLNRR